MGPQIPFSQCPLPQAAQVPVAGRGGRIREKPELTVS